MNEAVRAQPPRADSAGSTTPAGESEGALWSALLRGDADARRRLVDAHAPLARRVAAQLYARRPDDLADFADYLHEGMVGLLEALGRFDPARGASFTTYATHRIRGAILNGIARISEKRALHEHSLRLRAERVRSLRQESEGAPDESFRELVDVTIGLTLGLLLETANEETRAASAEAANPYASCALADARARVAGAVAGLPERERFIVRRHYFDQVSFAEIAELLGLTRGRVSQLHGRALRRIREAYEAKRPLDETF